MPLWRKITEALKQISDAGHEIGNHSFNHEPWLHLYSKQELIEEFEKTEKAIAKITNQKLKGFRGPGYSLSPTVLEVLAERDYEYDCSTLPTYIAPLARAYYFFKSPEMSDEEREKRKKLFGKFSDGFQSLKPYKWQIGEKTLTEIPVTTLPLLKTPIHASYVIYLSTFSKSLAKLYWQTRFANVPFDRNSAFLASASARFSVGRRCAGTQIFSGDESCGRRKARICQRNSGNVATKFDVVNMRKHAQVVEKENLRLLHYGKSEKQIA